jgi:hypothetical protein
MSTDEVKLQKEFSLIKTDSDNEEDDEEKVTVHELTSCKTVTIIHSSVKSQRWSRNVWPVINCNVRCQRLTSN